MSATRQSALLDTVDQLVLNPGPGQLHLNYGPIRVAGDGPDWGEATMEQAMADADRGSLPVDQRLPNRTITIPLVLGANGPERFRPARADLETIVALIQVNGGVLWRHTPELPSLYCDLVHASLKLPEKWAYMDAEVDVVLTLLAIPDFYGEEIERHIAGSDGSDLVLVEQGILGHYPGRTRIVLEDTEGQPKDGLLWAIRSQHYDPDAPPIYRAVDLSPVAPAAVSGQVVQRIGIGQTWAPILDWQSPDGHRPTHTGSYRVWARVQANVTGVRFRLQWGVGDLSAPTTNVVPGLVPTANNWHMVDLGEIRLDPSPVGHHHWLAQLQARADSGTATVQIEKLYLQSLELAGRLWAPTEPDVVLPAGGQAQLRTDGMLRQEQSIGADHPAYQPMSHVVGDLPRLFHGTNEILLRASRGDLDQRPDPDLSGEAFTCHIYYQPSYLNPIPSVLLVPPVIVYPYDGQVIEEQTPLIEGTGRPGFAVELTIDRRPAITIMVDEDGIWAYQVPEEDWLTFGTHRLQAQQTDLSGNYSAVVTGTFMIKLLGWDWAAVRDQYTSWAEVRERFASWDDLARRRPQ